MVVGIPPRRAASVHKAAIIALSVLLPCWHSAVALDTALDVNQYAHGTWRIKEGFISSEIRVIAQTTDGYLWLGTDSGLFRFDGVRTVRWVPPAVESRPDTHIRALLGTRDGALWIGTWGGLVSWRDGRLTSYPQLRGWFINGLLEDHEGAVWVSATSADVSVGRLCSINMNSLHCDGDDGRFGRGVGALHEDGSGHLWAASFAGLWQWSSSTPRLRSLPAKIAEGPQALADGEDGALLVVTNSGVLRLLGETVESLPAGLPSVPVSALLRDHDGALWVGTRDRGLLHVHRGRLDAFGKSDGLAGERVARIFEDREHNIWVVTDQGLNRFHDVTAATYSVEQGLSSLTTASVLAARDGSLWISTSNGLNRWGSLQIRVYAQRDVLPQERTASKMAVSEADQSGLPDGVGSLLEEGGGRIWVGSAKGLGYLENDHYTAITAISNGLIDAITEDPGGTVWVAHRDVGLLRVSGGRVVQQIPWEQFGRQKEARRLAADSRPNSLWLGFLLGGVAHFVDARVRESYSAKDGLAAGRVHDLRLDPDGTVWVGAEGGLSRIRQGRISTLNSRSGLPCDAVDWTMRDDARALWVYTACGIARIERTELERWEAGVTGGRSGSAIRATVIDSSEGVVINAPPISSWSPHVAKARDGRIWFATSTGVGVVDPRNLHMNQLAPPVYIEQVIADRKSYAPVTPLRLPAQLRDLVIDYTALSFVAPEKMLFRYKLEGHDRDWQEAGNRRQAFYSDLAPGSYRLRVIASNNSGVWNEEGAALDFSIAPAYWQTTWFRALCVTTILLVLWALYQLRLRQIARAFNVRLEERVAERTRIARDLHDTLLQSFQGLLLRFQTVHEMLPQRSADAKETLASAIDQTAQAITEGREAVQGLRASTVESNDLAMALTSLGQELAAEAGSDPSSGLRVQVEGTARTLHPIVRDEIFRIAGEALRNAFRHAGAQQIEVELRYDERQLRLRVRDDGKGIDLKLLAAEGLPGHFGLHGMRERAELVGGKLTVWSAPGSGTEIELTIVAARAYAEYAARGRAWFGEKPGEKGSQSES